MGGGGSPARALPGGGGGGGNSGGMRGNPPAIFTRDRSKSDEFLEDFKVYRMAN